MNAQTEAVSVANGIVDGSVSAMLQHADEAVLSRLVVWMRQGPPGARVTELVLNKVESAQRYDRFEIRRW